MSHFSTQKLAALLKDAAAAHHQYEQELGHRDDAWAQWYADYIVTQLEKEK